MRKNIILKSLLLVILLLLICNTKSYCVENGTVRMKIDGGTAWTNINISESYEECLSLNSINSTLGTGALRAHLTTDAEWSAMAILSVSQYGASTTNTPTWTTGNNSGIKDISKKYTQTTGIIENATKDSNEYISGLFNDDGTVKEYVKQWPTDRMQTNSVGFIDTAGWYNSSNSFGSSTSYPVSMRNGLFGFAIGTNGLPGTPGSPFDSVTFRPVIWN